MDEKPTIRTFDLVEWAPGVFFYEPGHVEKGVADDLAIEKRFTDLELAADLYEQTERFERAMHGEEHDSLGNRMESLAVESNRLGVMGRMNELPDWDDEGEINYAEDDDY